MKYVLVLVFLVGIIAGGNYLYYHTDFFHGHHQTGSHPVGYADGDDEVHVHSDFLVSIDGERYDFTDDVYQSLPGQAAQHAHIHLHDNNGEVIHRHAADVTLGEFFASLGFTLTEDCITVRDGTEYCTNTEKVLRLYVNGEQVSPIASYVNQEEDQILLFYGEPDEATIVALQEEITDTACIYSGTCPERGIAPPETCGLTCEL